MRRRWELKGLDDGHIGCVGDVEIGILADCNTAITQAEVKNNKTNIMQLPSRIAS